MGQSVRLTEAKVDHPAQSSDTHHDHSTDSGGTASGRLISRRCRLAADSVARLDQPVPLKLCVDFWDSEELPLKGAEENESGTID